ncbi:unnamed protein product [Peniophora sp. CBMAI 1063]|nr:unnamed protein product [Peniophora sp. CBMAI 1063]
MDQQVLSTLELVAQVFQHLDGGSLMRCRKVNTLFDLVAQEEWRARVHAHTAPFVCDVSHFYFLLGGVEGVVSGSTALAVILSGSEFDGFLQPTSDLDVYLPTEVGRDEIVRHLVSSEGYRVDSGTTSSGEELWKRKPDTIISLTRLTRVAGDVKHSVDIVVGTDHAATTPILSFWGSLVMNYISETSIVCLYPRLTLRGRFFTRPGIQADIISDPLQKYIDRGFHRVHRTQHSGFCGSRQSYCPGRFRFTEDAASMRVDWQSRGGAYLPYGLRSPSSVPSAYWKWSTCTRVIYDKPYEDTSDGCVVGRL